MAGTFRPVWLMTSPYGQVHYGIGTTPGEALASLGVVGGGDPELAPKKWDVRMLDVNRHSVIVRFKGRAAVAEFERLGGFAQEGGSPIRLQHCPMFGLPYSEGRSKIVPVVYQVHHQVELDAWTEEGRIDELWLDIEIPQWHATPPTGTHPDDDAEY